MNRTPEFMVAHQICFLLASAEHDLNIRPYGLPLDARIHRILAGAMEEPQAVSSSTYEILYLLLGDTALREVSDKFSAPIRNRSGDTGAVS